MTTAGGTLVVDLAAMPVTAFITTKSTTRPTTIWIAASPGVGFFLRRERDPDPDLEPVVVRGCFGEPFGDFAADFVTCEGRDFLGAVSLVSGSGAPVGIGAAGAAAAVRGTTSVRARAAIISTWSAV